MQPAGPATVLGDFNDARFPLRGKTWRFFRRGASFLVLAEGPDDALHEYEIAYTFGIDPLQQYLVRFPGGRMQCLPVAWDTRARRWFFLYPGRNIPPTDWLHWTRQAQNWNGMCADCHSTDVRKGYAAAADTFHTTWSEVTVGCEACHGPASRHMAWAEQPARGRLRVDNFALATRTSGISNRALVELCVPCHSRRAQIADQGVAGAPLLDRYLPVLLVPGLFHADGQILDEDYEYHSFIQSRMYANKVSCRECHDVHSGRRFADGNALCTRCHPAATFDRKSHHFHKVDRDGVPSPGALCVSCHMPGRSYMVVHFRRDHSLRVPRPDLSDSLGTPNACNAAGCHADRSAEWAARTCDRWYGRKRKPHYGTVLAAGIAGRSGAGHDLTQLAGDRLRPAIARASALGLLARYPGPEADSALERALRDEDALVRHTAARTLAPSDPAELTRALAPLLRDSVRTVRSAAAARLAEVPAGFLTAAQLREQAAVLAEFVAIQQYTSDMPSGPYNLANLEMIQGRYTEAEAHYRRALAIDEQFIPARTNLALLLSHLGRNADAATLLREVVAAEPGNAVAAFNLALLLAEEGRPGEAERLLRASLKADPAMANAAYNLAVLTAARRPAEALSLARRAAELRPDQPKYAWFLADILEREGRGDEATAVLRGALGMKGLSDADRARIQARLAGVLPTPAGP